MANRKDATRLNYSLLAIRYPLVLGEPEQKNNKHHDRSLNRQVEAERQVDDRDNDPVELDNGEIDPEEVGNPTGERDQQQIFQPAQLQLLFQIRLSRPRVFVPIEQRTTSLRADRAAEYLTRYASPSLAVEVSARIVNNGLTTRGAVGAARLSSREGRWSERSKLSSGDRRRSPVVPRRPARGGVRPVRRRRDRRGRHLRRCGRRARARRRRRPSAARSRHAGGARVFRADVSARAIPERPG